MASKIYSSPLVALAAVRLRRRVCSCCYECVMENEFSYFSSKTYVVGTQKNRLNETVLFEHPKHMFKLMS